MINSTISNFMRNTRHHSFITDPENQLSNLPLEGQMQSNLCLPTVLSCNTLRPNNQLLTRVTIKWDTLWHRDAFLASTVSAGKAASFSNASCHTARACWGCSRRSQTSPCFSAKSPNLLPSRLKTTQHQTFRKTVDNRKSRNPSLCPKIEITAIYIK